ncbi:unnamed protein product [Caenorhabditis angaria]|uniref:Nucleolar protein 9 n=1 Tax=Caenorhabditis angaria TaxID=860376 RepID=A0A9P1ILN8_9PELO|nr:unnamed protein product [Caenorhabditis angaria]
MTRKRKNVEENRETPKSFENYGFVKKEEPEAEPRRSFPEKRSRQDFRAQKKPNYEANFEQQYGRIGGEDAEAEAEGNSDAARKDDATRGEFPKEIVTYLRNIEQVKKQENGKLEDFILEKCAEEVAGQESTLLEWTEAAVVVENVFGTSQYGANLFLSSLLKLKHKKVLTLIFGGASARTIENLLYKMCPVENAQNLAPLVKLVDLMVDNWNDILATQSSAFLLRAILRITCGFTRGNRAVENQELPVKFKDADVKIEMKSIFERVSVMGFDWNLNREIVQQPIGSLVLQDLIEADKMWKTRKADEFVAQFLAKDEDGSQLRQSWRGKQSSRFWEKLVESCAEEARNMIWMGAISGHLEELAQDQFANFPLQKLIGAVTSLELATDIIDELAPFFVNILVSDKSGLPRAALKCAARHDATQELLLKKLRAHFRAEKTTTKTHFLWNILTNNTFDGKFVNFDKFTVQGSLLIGELLEFSKTKTLSACFMEISPENLREMCRHKIGSRVIQAALASKNLDVEVKQKIVGLFDRDTWQPLITDTYGSHVFEKIWTFVDVRQKQEIMKVLVGIFDTSKFWRFAMLKCDQKLFRQDRKAWIAKWK